MSTYIKNINITPGQAFGPLEITVENYLGDIVTIANYEVEARVWRTMDSLPLSANHDFDAETMFMMGALINEEPEVIVYETYEGN